MTKLVVLLRKRGWQNSETGDEIGNVKVTECCIDYIAVSDSAQYTIELDVEFKLKWKGFLPSSKTTFRKKTIHHPTAVNHRLP